MKLTAFVLASIVIVAVPGPSVLFTIGRALVLGRRAALATVFGNATGITGQVLVIAVGLGSLVAASALAFSVIRVVGAGYLIWLGIQAIRHRDDPAVDVQPSGSAFRQGMVVGFTNPKSLVFLSALLPQFVDRAAPMIPQLLALGAVFVAIAVVLDSCWALAAARAKGWFATSPSRLGRLRAVGGSMLVGLGLVTLMTRRI